MSAALYVGDCLIGTLERWPELDAPDHWIHYRFRPCDGFEAYAELLDPPDKKQRETQAWRAAVDALDLRLVESGREERFRYVVIEGEMAAFRAGAIRLCPAEEEEWRKQLASRRGSWRSFLDALASWPRSGVDRR